MKDARNAGQLQGSDLTMLVGFGVGYSWGATLVRWPVRPEPGRGPAIPRKSIATNENGTTTPTAVPASIDRGEDPS
jgi:hypothetical protein